MTVETMHVVTVSRKSVKATVPNVLRCLVYFDPKRVKTPIHDSRTINAVS